MLDSGIYAHGDLAGRVIASVDIIGTGDPKRTTPTDGTDPYGHGTPASVKSRLMFSADKEIDPSPFARSAGSLDLMAALWAIRSPNPTDYRIFVG